MKILLFSDCEIINGKIINPYDLYLEHLPDLVVSCGDLSEIFYRKMKRIPVRKIGVYGNHCAPGSLTFGDIEEITEYNTIDVNGITFTGYSGCPAYRDGPFQRTSDEELIAWRDMPLADIVVSHAPPLGINDSFEQLGEVAYDVDSQHVGWEGAKHYLKRNRNLQYYFHGHTEIDREERQMGRLKIVHVFGFYTIII